MMFGFDSAAKAARCEASRIRQARQDRSLIIFPMWRPSNTSGTTHKRGDISNTCEDGFTSSRQFGEQPALSELIACFDRDQPTTRCPGDAEHGLIPTTPKAPVRDSSMQPALDAARASFDKQTWKCFWLVAREGHSAVEVAEQLGMKPAAVRQAKYRVTQRLRRDLEHFS